SVAIRRSQWLTSVDFPTPAQATIVTTFTCWFAQTSSRKAISSSRPKTSLPVTGNPATEIFFGPSLVDDLRDPRRETAGGACYRRHCHQKLCRALETSTWVFLEEHLKHDNDRLWNSF